MKFAATIRTPFRFSFFRQLLIYSRHCDLPFRVLHQI